MAEGIAERAFEQVRERGLPEGTDADRGHRDPDLHGGYVLVDVVELLQCKGRAALTVLGHHLEARAARAHERVLGDDEERVDRDQQRREDQRDGVHARLRGPAGSGRLRWGRRRARRPRRGPFRANLLRGGSSSSLIACRRAKGSKGLKEARCGLRSGELVDPAEYYFRASPTFLVPAGVYDWLNKGVFVATGARYARAIELWFYRVT